MHGSERERERWREKERERKHFQMFQRTLWKHGCSTHWMLVDVRMQRQNGIHLVLIVVVYVLEYRVARQLNLVKIKDK